MVMVPVLSRHSVSTRANNSTDANSLAKAWRLASTITPARKDTLVSSTRPSGTIATDAATVPLRASCHITLADFMMFMSFAVSRRMHSKIATGGMMAVSQCNILLISLLSLLSTNLNRLASSASCAA